MRILTNVSISKYRSKQTRREVTYDESSHLSDAILRRDRLVDICRGLA